MVIALVVAGHHCSVCPCSSHFAPADLRITRGTTIFRSGVGSCLRRSMIFINWEAWSPWAKLDPAMKDHNTKGQRRGTGAGV